MGARMTKSIVETCMEKTIYHPPVASYSKYTAHFIRTTDGEKLALRCVSPGESAMTLHSKYTDHRHVVLYSHGNAVDLGIMMPFYKCARARCHTLHTNPCTAPPLHNRACAARTAAL